MYYNAESNKYEAKYSVDSRRSVNVCCFCIRSDWWEKVGIHPDRVKKLMVSTNICGKKLAASDYKFHYTLEESFRDWFNDCNKEGLF